jgi:predicted transcriptional regulator
MKTIKEMSKEERKELVYLIIKEDELSISELVYIKERSVQETMKELRTLVSALSYQSATLFMNKEAQELIKPALAQSLIKSKQFKGTSFEKELMLEI